MRKHCASSGTNQRIFMFMLTEARRRAIQRPKIEHLLDLIRRKRVLLTELDGCQARQQIAFSATVDKVQLAIDARLAALSE